jgi:GcrA cell cycle regulator
MLQAQFAAVEAPHGERPSPITRVAGLARGAANGWTDERVETLKRLWRDGLSAAQVAKALGGVTRNAVIGKVHRLGLSGSRSAANRRPRSAKVRPARLPRGRTIAASPAEAETARFEEPAGLARRLEDLCIRACKWPIGDPKAEDFAFCGRDAEDGPYCVVHRRRAYTPGGVRPRHARDLMKLLRVA